MKWKNEERSMWGPRMSVGNWLLGARLFVGISWNSGWGGGGVGGSTMGILDWDASILSPVKRRGFPFFPVCTLSEYSIWKYICCLFAPLQLSSLEIIIRYKNWLIDSNTLRRSVNALLSVLSVFIDQISQRNSTENLKKFVIFFLPIWTNLVTR
jgi:hypothetical protein